jgi:hypothetical protein
MEIQVLRFNVLCFGLATAGFIFSKVLRELIKYWRSKSIIIIMYLDDGLGGTETDYYKCILNKKESYLFCPE